jgi:cytochrome P450
MDGADELEVVGIAMEMTRAGLDTTRRQLACTMYALLQNPTEWKRLAADPSLAPTVVEEGMRYASITHVISRQAIADKEIAGVAATPGMVFTAMAAIVNRDPAVYRNPDQFDAARSPCPHMTFGSGSHACVGAPLARMEMIEAFSSLGERIESIELAGEVPRSPVSTGSVPQSLPVRLIGRPAA